MAYATLDDVMDLAEGLVVSVVGTRARDARKRELKTLERDTTKLEKREGAVPAHLVRRGGRDCCKKKGLPFEWGGDFGAPDETALSEEIRPAGLRPPLSVGGEGVLHEAGSRAAGGRARRRRARAGRLRRDHRRRRAHSTTTICCCSGSRSTTCRRKRSSGISTCAATAACRTAASAWASSAWSPGSAASSTCARRFPYPRMLYRIYP